MSLYEENARVLSDLASKGRDLESPRLIDFAHLFPDRSSAQDFADEAKQEDFAVEIREYGEEPGSWDATASKVMVPTCENITEAEERLASIAEKHGGCPDGWGFLNP